MQVFKYYFKLAKSMRGGILIYVGTFVLASIAMSAQIPNGSTTYTAQKPNVAIVNRDNGEFAKGYVDYMKNSSNIVALKDTSEARKEAVYFQTVDAIFVIPDHFSADFFAGKNPQIDYTRSTGEQAEVASSLTSNYLRLAEPRVMAGMSQIDAVSGIKGDVAKQVTVKTKSQANVNEVGKMMYFVNTQAYIILGLNIMVISTIMLLLNERMIKRRNLVSPVSYKRISAQLLAANAVFTVAIWAVFLVAAYFLYPHAVMSMYGLLYGIGSLMFSLVALAIGFMVGSLVSSRRAVPGITNVVALGMSFLCGVFMPQQFLGESVVNFSKSLPAYWFINANNLIAKLSDFSASSLQPIITDWLVVLAFAVGLFALTIILLRTRQREN